MPKCDFNKVTKQERMWKQQRLMWKLVTLLRPATLLKKRL